jgi:photosystem II stability/assembly factor-like uncharacterized protein
MLDLAVWAGNPDVLLARPEAAPAWRSVDGGTMWAELDGFQFHDLTSIGTTFYTTDSMILRRSDDGWETSQGLPFSSQFVPYTLAVDPARPEALYVASAGLVHASDDGGQSWTEWFDYPPIGFPAAMAVGPDGTLHVAASRGSAVVELLAGGDEVHWYGGGISGTGRSLGEPVDGLLYAASSDGVFVSAHVGLTWATIASQLQIAEDSPTPTTIRTAPSDPAVLYVRYPDPKDGVTGRLARSDDAGMSWIDLGPQPLPAVVDPVDPHVVYRILAGVLSISVDGARVWTAIDLSPGRITGAFPDQTDPAAILVATEADGRVELIRVTDRGGAAIPIFDSEEDLAGTLPLGRVVDLHGTSGGEIVVATLSGALLRGRAGSWSVVEPATDVEANLQHLTAHPTNPRALFGIAGGLVLRSDDLGTSWCRQDEALTGVEELAALGGTPQTLVASDGERIYRMPIAP